jgi:site-specific DNA-cytosine methylase
VSERRYRVAFPFCGVGGGALGFKRAAARVLSVDGSFEIVGGFDFDNGACDDFEMFTDAPAMRRAVESITPADLRLAWGESPPDIVFMSPPCCGASGLLNKELSATEKYQTMNELALVWIQLMLESWPTAQPKFLLFENVPLLKHRAKKMLAEVKRLLRARGYAIHEGFHDCGELGGLAQHRRRYLMVARDQKRVPYPIYKPIRKRVRACGDVLGLLPMPGDPNGGVMHELPKISWLNLVRLSLIPAGGDWRDLPNVLADGQARRELFKRHAVEKWEEPTGTIGGSGTNGVANVADPRIVPQIGNPNMHQGKYQVREWDEPTGTITGATRVGSGAQSVADPRHATWGGGRLGVKGWDELSSTITADARPAKGAFTIADPRINGALGVRHWDEPAGTVTGESYPSNGAFSVADPRAPPFGNVDRVTRWDRPMGTVTRSPAPSSGAAAVANPRAGEWFSNCLRVTPWLEPFPTVTAGRGPTNGGGTVADPRIALIHDSGRRDHYFRVLRWTEPSFAIATKIHPGTGAYTVADPRIGGPYAVLDWRDAAATLETAGPFAISRAAESDPVAFIERVDRPPFLQQGKKRVPMSVVIVSEDGTWHRPLTTLELAALQGFPTEWRGAPLKLSGASHTEYRRRIGNAVPPPTAEAIAVRFLVTLLQAEAGAFSLSDAGPVWVGPTPELPDHLEVIQ